MELQLSQLFGLIGLIALGVAVFVSKLCTLYRIRYGKRPYLFGLLPGSPVFLFACSCFAYAYALKYHSHYVGWCAIGGTVTSLALVMVLVRLWAEGLMARSSNRKDHAL
jgi:hypothetical protein